MRYKVRIVSIEDVEVEEKQWRIVSSDNGKDRYDYVVLPVRRTNERDMLIQEVETIDVGAVIKAINGL